MKQNSSQLSYMFSFIFEQSVESTKSELNPSLEVTLHNGRYKLTTPNAVYSYEDLYTSFAVTFQRISIEKKDIKNALLLGYGIGSIPVILSKNHNCNPKFTAVEIDPEIIRLAGKYGVDQPNKPVDIICADAYDYVKTCNTKFDLVAVDIFIDDMVPQKFESEEFLQNVSSLLSDKGLLFYNRMTIKEENLQKTEVFFDKYFSKVFPRSRALSVGGNRMLVFENNGS